MNDLQEILLRLPPREIFPEAMPRYPNLFFLVDPRLATRSEYRLAVIALARILERHLGLRDTFGEDIENSQLRTAARLAGEGADFQARIGPVQYYLDAAHHERSHWHQLHARFYATPLLRWNGGVSSLHGEPAARDFFLVAASVHYEVATEDPRHPYEDECPICGMTGVYHLPVERGSQDYCVKIHDPLGLEFLLEGRIRGVPVQDTDGGRVRSISDLARLFACTVRLFEQPADEPRKMAIVSVSPFEAAASAAFG